MKLLSAVIPFLSYAIYAIAAFLVLLGAFLGWRRGAGKQLVHVLLLAITVILSVLFAERIGLLVISEADGKSVWELLEMLQIPKIFAIDPMRKEVLMNLAPGSETYVLPLAAALLVKPACFLACFFAIDLVFFFLCWIVRGITAAYPSNRTADPDRFFGTFFGIVRALIVVLVLTFPIASFCRFAGETAIAIREEAPGSETADAVTEKFNNLVRPLASNPIVGCTRVLGGDFLADRFAMVVVNEEQLDLYKKGTAAAGVLERCDIFTKETDWAQLTDGERAALDGIVSSIEEDDYLDALYAGALPGFLSRANRVISGKEEMGEPLRNYLLLSLQVFSADDSLTFRKDLSSVVKAYELLADAGVLAVMDENGDVTAALQVRDEAGASVTEKVMAALAEGDHTSAVRGWIVSLDGTYQAPQAEETAEETAEGSQTEEPAEEASEEPAA